MTAINYMLVTELKPCPFCGGEAQLLSEYGIPGNSGRHRVACSACEVSTKEYHWYRILPIEDWNERTDDL